MKRHVRRFGLVFVVAGLFVCLFVKDEREAREILCLHSSFWNKKRFIFNSHFITPLKSLRVLTTITQHQHYRLWRNNGWSDWGKIKHKQDSPIQYVQSLQGMWLEKRLGKWGWNPEFSFKFQVKRLHIFGHGKYIWIADSYRMSP